jgi:hypothetical protein
VPRYEDGHDQRRNDAAQRIEQGIERYAAGDIAAAGREFEEALRICPGHELAERYLGWVRSLQSGAQRVTSPVADRRAPAASIGDALQILDDALSAAQNAPIDPTAGARDPLADSPWDLPDFVRPQPISQPTLQGVQPAGPMILPALTAPTTDFYGDDTTSASTKRWTGVPTRNNLAPLDVPELTDEQIRLLAELDDSEPTQLRHAPQRPPESEVVPIPVEPDPQDDPPLTLTPLAAFDDPPTTEMTRPRRISKPGYDTNETPALTPEPGVQAAIDRGDADGAYSAAEEFLAKNGGLESATTRPQYWLLERAYETYLGSLDSVVTYGRPTPDLDPRSAFLLSRVDQMATADELLEVSGMPRIEAIRILARLVHAGALTLRPY